MCTKLRRRGRVLERYRLAQCDGGSAPCAGGAHILLSQLRAGAAALRMSDPDFRQGYPFTVEDPPSQFGGVRDVMKNMRKTRTVIYI